MHLNRKQCRVARATTGIIGTIFIILAVYYGGRAIGFNLFVQNVFPFSVLSNFLNWVANINILLIVALFGAMIAHMFIKIYNASRQIFCPLK